MKHLCHWPGCDKEVNPALFACAPHWFRLPDAIRTRIRMAYRPGQEIDKRPSAAYRAAALDARRWACNYITHKIARARKP